MTLDARACLRSNFGAMHTTRTVPAALGLDSVWQMQILIDAQYKVACLFSRPIDWRIEEYRVSPTGCYLRTPKEEQELSEFHIEKTHQSSLKNLFSLECRFCEFVISNDPFWQWRSIIGQIWLTNMFGPSFSFNIGLHRNWKLVCLFYPDPGQFVFGLCLALHNPQGNKIENRCPYMTFFYMTFFYESIVSWLGLAY